MATTRFEWDPDKDKENQRKHGVPFANAQFAFADPSRVIAEDLSHSLGEKRYYCFGRVEDGVTDGSFHLPSRRRSASLVLATGEGARQSMSAKIRYTDEPLGRLKVVPDFLPPPEDLVFRDEGVKVTIALSKRSVEFFKGEARKHNTQYQRMIRRLLDAYAEHYARRETTRSTRPRRPSPA